jgi:hypothetical protein
MKLIVVSKVKRTLSMIPFGCLKIKTIEGGLQMGEDIFKEG